MTTETLKEKMDQAIELAVKELGTMPEKDLEALGGWFLRNFRTCGWKRLGRALRERLEGDLPGAVSEWPHGVSEGE